MKPVHAVKPGVMSCWKVHKKPSPIALFQGRPLRVPSAERCFRTGSDPKRWFAEWAKELSIGRKDRAWHEMHTLIDIFCQAGRHDQLNMGALACMVLVSRRFPQFTEACAHGADADNCPSAKHFSGSSSLDLVPPQMRSHASRLSRQEAELEHLRARAETHAAGASSGVGAAAAAVLVGGLPGNVESW